MSPGQESVDQWLAENYTPPFKRQESAHDPLCRLNVTDCGYGNTNVCHCLLIARARADERAKVAREEVMIYARAWDEVSDEVFEKVNAYDALRAQVQACDAHITQVRWAEAVAARLVEAICEDADTIAMLLRDFDVVVKQRDVARAEVAALLRDQDTWAQNIRADERERWLKSDHLERALEQARADERERIAQEIEAIELPVVISQRDLIVMDKINSYLKRCARIARGGGQ